VEEGGRTRTPNFKKLLADAMLGDSAPNNLRAKLLGPAAWRECRRSGDRWAERVHADPGRTDCARECLANCRYHRSPAFGLPANDRASVERVDRNECRRPCYRTELERHPASHDCFATSRSASWSRFSSRLYEPGDLRRSMAPRRGADTDGYTPRTAANGRSPHSDLPGLGPGAGLGPGPTQPRLAKRPAALGVLTAFVTATGELAVITYLCSKALARAR
jgi:hypothetical protein